MDIPKIIWFCWHQGWDEAPELIKVCYESWVAHNGDYQVLFVDKDNLDKYVRIDESILSNPNIQYPALSDIIRINLLKTHGGIWADATCYCMQPVDSYLHEYLPSGFFAYKHWRSDRHLASWFLMAERNNYLINRWCDAVNNYWTSNPQLKLCGKQDRVRRKFIGTVKAIASLNTQFWFSYPVRKTLEIYPYFYFHFMFTMIYNRDPEVRKIWDATPSISNLPGDVFRSHGYNNPISEELKEEIDQHRIPLYKLNRHVNIDEGDEASAMNYILGIHHNKIKNMLRI